MTMWGNEDIHICPLCGRMHTTPNMSWHHLFPKDGCDEKAEPRIYVCLTCHSVIHFCHTNKQLRELYNTIEKILSSTSINKMINLYKYDHKNNKIYKIKKLKQLQKCA
jgi:hypothetical protein